MGMEKGSGLNFGPYDYNSGSGGSGSIGTGAYNVKVIDYDGTVIAEKNLNEGDSFTLPKAPSHDGLVFQEWSATQDIVNGKITIGKSNVMVGAIYTTASGQNEFDITLTAFTGLSVTLNLDGTKDWGDGTTDTNTSHTYTQAGDYTIKCNGTTMTTSSSSGLFGQNSSSKNYYCTSVRLATITEITIYALSYCSSLAKISLSNICTTVGSNSMQNSALSTIIFPNSITNINVACCQAVYTLQNLILTNSISLITNYCFYVSYSLQKVIIPKSISTLNAGCFSSCSYVIEYDFSQHTSVPTLSNINAFAGINDICKIKVPSALYDEWIEEANWVTYKDYIVAV